MADPLLFGNGSIAETAIGTVARAHGVAVERWPGETHRAARLAADREGYEIRVRLQAKPAIVFVASSAIRDAARHGALGVEGMMGALDDAIGAEAARMRARTMLQLLDGGQALDFAGADSETALERTERAAVRLAEVSAKLMGEVEAMRARERGGL